MQPAFQKALNLTWCPQLTGRRVLLALFVFALSLVASFNAAAGQVRVNILDSLSGQRIPGRIHLYHENGTPVKSVTQLPSWKDHVSTAGSAAFDLSPGNYRLEVERGHEWTRVSRELTVGVQDKASTEINVSLKRIANMANEGWWSGEMHIHRPIEQAKLLLDAEDLHFGQFISWWNRSNRWKNQAPPKPAIRSLAQSRSVQLLGGEDERDGGALLFFNLEETIDITGGRKHFPSSLQYARQVKSAGGWIDIEKPFWWDVPMWIANDIGDSIGIANNHMYRRGALANEAWGRPRDLKQFPGPQGNALWTQAIYYHLLNCGIRIPPSAGSASGVLPNPVGYNRVYVHLDGEPTMKNWFKGLKAGKVFVSNGPLLRATANGKFPGHVFRSNRQSMLITLNAQVDGNDPISALEVVVNGEVKPFPFPQHLTMHESGWFLIRARTGREDGLEFASTGPFYVELGGSKKGPNQKESAQFFERWCKDRITTLTANTELTPAQRDKVLQPWNTALTFWTSKAAEAPSRFTVRGKVTDTKTGQALSSRVYIRDESGRWHHPVSSSPDGSAVRYEKRNWINDKSEEFHTTLSAHPFEIKLPPGNYELTVERGKEYVPLTRRFSVKNGNVDLDLELKRWINMAARGWYSGDTHVHRTLKDLPNVMLAEDLNVTFPLTYWVTKAYRAPTAGDKTTHGTVPDELIKIDNTHVIWPRNTEWEIFSVGPKRHTLGAVFALGHKEPFNLGVPGVKEVAKVAREQGALLDLDKHDWPWSMTLPPNMGVHLYELANNHVWRTEFAFTNWNSATPPYRRPPLQPQSGNHHEWVIYTMENYYALLNCGLKMVPTAGTASGVHPVPLGFGRVYVQLANQFSYEAWKDGLTKGHSFVTTGPMIFAQLNQKGPGWLPPIKGKKFSSTLTGEIISQTPLSATEILKDGKVIHSITPTNTRHAEGGFSNRIELPVSSSASSWFAVRCWEERPDGPIRYAHTAPWHITIEGQPLKPRKEERDYLVSRVQAEINRSKEILSESDLMEYRQALDYYQSLEVRQVDQ